MGLDVVSLSRSTWALGLRPAIHSPTHYIEDRVTLLKRRRGDHETDGKGPAAKERWVYKTFTNLTVYKRTRSPAAT